MNNKSRSQHPAYTVKRIDVPNDKVTWNTQFDNYLKDRPLYTHTAVETNLLLLDDDKKRWAEPHDLDAEKNSYLKTRITFINGYKQTMEEAGIKFDKYNLPINPMGRTGMWGPGLLGKNGPNQAADPIFTRWAPFTWDRINNALKKCITNYPRKKNFCNLFKELILLFPHLEMIAIQRRDTKDWAIPGGMVEAGQTVSQTLRNEINEEACNNMDPDKASKEIDEILNREENNIIYCGYVDDPRNTDSRWMETTAVHFHCQSKLAYQIKLEAGDDAQNVTWLKMTSLEPRYENLYASHKIMTDSAMMDIIWKYYIDLIIDYLSGFTIATAIVYTYRLDKLDSTDADADANTSTNNIYYMMYCYMSVFMIILMIRKYYV